MQQLLQTLRLLLHLKLNRSGYREAAASLGVCERTIWGLVRDGKLNAVRIGRSVRVPVAELERFVSGQQSQASPSQGDAVETRS